MTRNDKRVKYACYVTNLSMSVVSNIAPVLFLTFRELYGISFTALGFLVLVNFTTQLVIDLIFSLFSHKINMGACVKLIPIINFLGLVVFAAAPTLFPNNVYLGLLLGTLGFSASGAFVEVLISPVIAALPSENPDREVSALHSVYAWGTVGVVIISTLYILAFGSDSWQWLALFYTVVPIISAALYFSSKLPELEKPTRASGAVRTFKNPVLWLCFFAIFLGGAAECTMSQWSSSYIEAALGIPKVYGDVFGVALFALTLGIGRTLYAKYGKNVERVLLFGALSAVACYLVAALSPMPIIGLIACALTGFATSMLWPGGVIVGSERVSGGVLVYAMMAAGGDLGASVGPQLVGLITDTVVASSSLSELAVSLGITAEELGMRAGILVGALFPLVATLFYLYMLKTRRKKQMK